MKVSVNGNVRDMTPEELSAIETANQEAERKYWLTTPYGVAVNTEIRKRYLDHEENAILRQRNEKPEEYAEYYAYCEECKEFVRAKQSEYKT